MSDHGTGFLGARIILLKNKMNDNVSTGINFGFEDGKFFVDYQSADKPVGNLRQEFDRRARDLYTNNKNLMLGLSSGLDSQAVLHSFYTQDIPLECAFLYMPGYNDNEFSNIKILEKKYGFECIIIEIDPIDVKDQVMFLHEEHNIPPNQMLHRLFLDKLPRDKDFMQGIHGPDFLYRNDKWYIFETANSFEIARLRAFLTLDRPGKIIGWERTPEIMLSLLSDDIVISFMNAYPYIKQNRLIYDDGSAIPVMDYWDLYIKPYFYGKYWTDELEYFPKYQGCEKIDYIMQGPRHDFNKNMTAISYRRLIDQLKSTNSEKIRVYQL